jgi:ubiquitin carboxyl-terminal hydrolase 10
VAFPPRLKVNRSWLSPDCAQRGAEYELVATVTHHGKTIGSGHYTADVRQPCGT